MNIYNIQSGQNFAHIFCKYVLNKYAKNILDITELNVWVPSNRIAETIKQEFYTINGDMLLPQISAFSLGEDSEEELLFNNPKEQKKQAISLIEKHLILTAQVSAMNKNKSITSAINGAEELLKLHSRLITWGVNIADIEDLVPEDLAIHWQENLTFLNIVFKTYPTILSAMNKCDPVELKQSILYKKSENLSTNPQMAVGFTDTTPAGMAMLKAISKHPLGEIILPNIDTNMPDEIWQNLHPTHPQYSICNMLKNIEVERKDIINIENNAPTNEALAWQQILAPCLQTGSENKLDNISIVEANSETEEAEVIALIMRETLNDKYANCTLVTSESSLATRVEAFLQKWDVIVDNSAGKPLTKTPIGELFCSIIDVISMEFKPLSLATVLHHNDFYIENKNSLIAIEKTVLRGVSPAPGISGLRKKLNDNNNFRISSDDINNSIELINFIEESFKPLQQKTKKTFENWLEKHLQVLEILTKKQLWQQRDDGDSFINFLSSWQNQGNVIGEISFNEYSQILKQFLKQVTVRKRCGTHPRLFICGALEARLKKFDRVIIGGANEGIWPRKYTPDPWLNPKMSEQLGLPSIEMAVGLGAQDFASLVTNKDVFITRTIKQGGEETIPSRFLTRFEVAKNDDYKNAVIKGDVWLSWLRNNKKIFTKQSKKQPAVVLPPLKNRPQVWSASFTKDMIQCPYKACIAKIMHLYKLDSYEEEPSPADKGNLLHNCLEAFYVGKTAFKYEITNENKHDALAHLLKISDELFKQELVSYPSVYAVWWSRFTRIAESFINIMLEIKLENRTPVLFEKEGERILKSGITLKARADRIDKSSNGAVLIDYKTGKPPSIKDVKNGIEPQIAVEAIILASGGYINSAYENAEFWQLKGSGEEGINITSALGKDENIDGWIDETIQGAEKLTSYFQKPNTQYLAIPNGSKFNKIKQCKYCDYAGICRFKEFVD